MTLMNMKGLTEKWTFDKTSLDGKMMKPWGIRLDYGFWSKVLPTNVLLLLLFQVYYTERERDILFCNPTLHHPRTDRP